MVDNPTFTMTIDLKGSGLTAFVPGQPIYDLVPQRGTQFRLKQVTGYGIRFVLDEKGAVTEALLLQPSAVYTIRRLSSRGAPGESGAEGSAVPRESRP